MPRPRSAHVSAVKAALVSRFDAGLAAPGGRFLSARALARHFSISYQTAHGLMAELEEEGWLRRKAGSGTFFSGRPARLLKAQLVFDERAKRRGSFGAHLLDLLGGELEHRGIATVRSWAGAGEAPPLRSGCFPVVWESPAAVRAAAAARRFLLNLNDAPPPGLGGGFIDAITTDDFSGGACAAELLKRRTGRAGGFAILGGPPDDPRGRRRIAGFCAHAADTRVVSAGSWFLEDGREHVGAILGGAPAGIFACNDRLAQAVLEARAPDGPPLVGFDDAPIAARLGLTTIGIPWAALVREAADLIEGRLGGHTGPARLVTLAHEPVLRFSA